MTQMDDHRRDAPGRTGVFIKTPAAAMAEIAGLSGLDFVVLDGEHAPIDLRAVDALVPAARSVGVQCLVRAPDHSAAFIGACLDLGADGVLIPRVGSAEQAAAVVHAARYSGGRGYSPSPRAFGYGRSSGPAARARADAHTEVWLQIEDAEGLANVTAIAALPGVDCLFIGPADLALSLSADGPTAPEVTAAMSVIAGAGLSAGVRVGAYVGDPNQIDAFAALGVTIFICGSDQSLFAAGARQIAATVKTLLHTEVQS
jgi:2-keto-3-deoxy-L-rhamnonate aldolase RhmA